MVPPGPGTKGRSSGIWCGLDWTHTVLLRMGAARGPPEQKYGACSLWKKEGADME